MTFSPHPAWLDLPEIKTLTAAFAAHKVPLRFVGGCVRDALLGREVKDIDAATPLAPEHVIDLLAVSAIKAVPTGLKHGTVTAVINGRHVEITTLRRDVATDGRHAEVEYTEDWEADAARRDFTINALYFSPEGELFDYFSGQEDLKAGRVRFIGEAEKRIKEDYLRILRFFRFHARYGKGTPDTIALKVCAELAPHLSELSGERVQEEMLKLLAAPQTHPVIRLMWEKGILDHAFGVKLNDVSPLEGLERQGLTSDPVAKLAALLKPLSADIRNKIAERLRLSNADARLLRQTEHIPPDATLAQQDELYHRVGSRGFAVSAIISAAAANNDDLLTAYKRMLEQQFPDCPVTGDDLIALGYKPGKDMGNMLCRLHEKWVDSKYRLSKEQLLSGLKG